jgi:hypothetical protein
VDGVARNRMGALGRAEMGRRSDDDARSDELNREIGRDIIIQ